MIFFCIRKASVHNFANDDTWSSFAKSVTLLIEILMAQSQKGKNTVNVSNYRNLCSEIF